MEVIIYICLALLLSFCILAAMSQSLLKSAIFLAFASATLGVILFVLGAPWAAVIEVSACSGLVTVIFISAISLSRIKKEEVQKLYADKKQMKYLPYILIIAGIVIIVAALAGSVALPGTAVESTEDFREVFWNSRQADILGQIVSILIGGIAVYVLMRESKD
ncbi:MAG TPA: hypothetical protein PKV51_08120 [Bacillota bacterium]|nr:hypothetical protein [Bacillota bacterium]HPP86062.1 hypothetical protein [Bacillota bacterium]